MSKPEVLVRRSNLTLVSRTSSFFCQPIYFLFTSLALLGILSVAKNVRSSLNSTLDDRTLLWLNSPDITDVHVTDLHPLLPAEVRRLRILAIPALDFDDTATFARLRSIVALLGDITISPEPEGTMNLYIVSTVRTIHVEGPTEVALRTIVAEGKSSTSTKPGTSTAPSKSMQHWASVWTTRPFR